MWIYAFIILCIYYIMYLLYYVFIILCIYYIMYYVYYVYFLDYVYATTMYVLACTAVWKCRTQLMWW